MARNFNGTTDLITAANSTSLESASSAFTLAALFRANTTQADDWGYIAAAGGATIQQDAAVTRQYVGSVTISGVFKVTARTTLLTADTWYLSVLRWASGGTVDLTIFNLDGSLNQTVSSTSHSGTIDDTGQVLLIGNSSGQVDGHTGAIARVVYDNVRYTDLECQHLLLGRLPSRGIAGAYLELFGTVSPEPDWSGNGNHGTVTGTTRVDHPPMISAEWYAPPTRRYWAITAVVTQKARPSTDTTRDNWEEDDGTTTTIFDQINETSADDANYIRTVLTPTNDVYVTKLTSVTDPQASTGHIVRYRYGKSETGGNRIDITVQLRQGYTSEPSQLGTLIKEWVHTDVAGGWTLAEQTLSGAEADSITDYGDLYIRIIGNKV